MHSHTDDKGDCQIDYIIGLLSNMGQALALSARSQVPTGIGDCHNLACYNRHLAYRSCILCGGTLYEVQVGYIGSLCVAD
jgi:hypothetical protein